MNKDKDIQVMKDCFGYLNNKCSILKSRKCVGTNCSFYKSKEKYREDDKRAMERILSLDPESRYHINTKYYNGLLEV